MRPALLVPVVLSCWLSSPVCAAPLAEAVGDRIVRFHADEASRAGVLPSLALERPRPSLGPAPPGFRTRPEFTSAGGGRIVRIAVERGTNLYGTGEVGGPLERTGRTTVCWNTDAYAYRADSPSLYQSHPWVLAVRADGSAYGVFADTPGRVVVDLTDGIVFRSQGPPFAVLAIERGSPDSVVMALAELTGRMPMPPRWALGFQQSRFSYAPDREVLRIARGFRDRRIPCDVVWVDIDYMHGFRSFTFDPVGFPAPRALNDSLHAAGFRSVWMIDPGIKLDPGYAVYDQGTRGGHWVLDRDGLPYSGAVWPGACVFPDFTRAATRAWWAGLYPDFLAQGVDGVWNDMNEPAVFGTPTKTMPETNRHDADPELGGPGLHTRYHNVYGMLMARATREGIAAARPDRRPFVLTRANHLGGQRYAATWTGDNVADRDHMAMSVPMVLNLGLSGQPFAGPDIGGYKGYGSPETFARWIGFGALLPFARAHTEKGVPAKEPWAFGPRTEATSRRAIEARYRLLPYLYGVFREASRTGLPVARPVFFADPTDPRLRKVDDAFLLGADLLVAADMELDRASEPVLPRGRWREVHAFNRDADGRRDPDLPRWFQRPGSIVPAGPVVQHVDAAPLDTLDLLVCLDDRGRARGVLYEDAGDGYGYERGEYRVTEFEARRAGREVEVSTRVVEGAWPTVARTLRVTVVGDASR
ncbi:MAG: TIM-barrel domain-containing protein [bacterium]